MSPPYKVLWSGAAEQDLKNILHIAADSPETAGNIFKKIKETASGLAHLPERGRLVPELQDQGIFLYHELISAPWRITYRISGKKVYVLSVIDSRRNVEDIHSPEKTDTITKLKNT